MEDNLNIFENGRRPQYFSNARRPHIFQMDDNINLIQMEYDLNILANGRQPIKKIIQPKTIKIKIMVLAPLRVT